MRKNIDIIIKFDEIVEKKLYLSDASTIDLLMKEVLILRSIF